MSVRELEEKKRTINDAQDTEQPHLCHTGFFLWGMGKRKKGRMEHIQRPRTYTSPKDSTTKHGCGEQRSNGQTSF